MQVRLLARLPLVAAVFVITAAFSGRATASDPPQYLVEERVDLVEVNHYFDDKGEFVLDQLIYYRWSDRERRFQVEDYKLLKRRAQRPIRHVSRDDYFSIWHDGQLLRCVHADSLIESWTQHDPEHEERRFLKNEHRSGLARLPEIDAGKPIIRR